MSEEVPVTIQGFKGLNLREPEGMVQDDELVECVNLDIGRAGELVKREGFSVLSNTGQFGNFPVTILGLYNTTAFSYLIAVSNSKLYRSTDGSVWTEIADGYNIAYGVQYDDDFYMVRPIGTVVKYDGTTVSTIADSPAGTSALVYKDRLYVINSSATGSGASRLHFSGIGDFADWPTTNTIDVQPGEGDKLVALSLIHDLLILFKSTSSWALYVQGPPENWILRNINPEIGCSSRNTPREIEGFLYFVGSRGAYRTDGNVFEDISESINTLFYQRSVDINNIHKDFAAWWEDKYILSLAITATERRFMVYHLRTQGWTEWVPASGISPSNIVEVQEASPGRGLYMGDTKNTGKIYKFGDNVYADAGIVYPCKLRTKEFDFLMASNTKRGKWITVDIAGQGLSQWKNYVNGDLAAVGEVTLPDAGRYAAKTKGPGYFRTWQLEMEYSSSYPFTFYSAVVAMHRKRTIIHGIN